MDDIPLAPVPPAVQKIHPQPAMKLRELSQDASSGGDHRRGFFGKVLAILIGALVGIFPFAAGLVVFLDPLRRKAGPAQKIAVATLDALPADGVPRQFPVLATRQDAWNRFLNEPIGAVFLRRLPGTDQVEALNAVCPHAGCLVAFKPDKNEFKCPCHTSAFEVDGQRVLPCVAPRGLDTLQCEVRRHGDEEQIVVTFANYYSGLAEKKLKA
jgi:menaquinol-cytochrome c reductase iron-sulfur subunit